MISISLAGRVHITESHVEKKAQNKGTGPHAETQARDKDSLSSYKETPKVNTHGMSHLPAIWL
jgi:hypothetical protein